MINIFTILRKPKAILLVLLAVCFAFSSTSAKVAYQGRINTYAISTFSTAYTPLSGATAMTFTSNDDGDASFSMPFDFNYDNIAVPTGTLVYVNSNGFIEFGTNPGSACCSNNVGSASYLKACMILSRDLYTPAGTGSVAQWQLAGTAPNRTVTVEYMGITTCCQGANTTRMEIVLYETTNVIEYWYQNWGFTMGGALNSAGVGLNGSNTPSFISVAYATGISATPATNIRFSPPQVVIPLPELSTSPKLLAFGQQFTGSFVDLTLTIKNVGSDANLVTNNFIITGNPDFSVTSPIPGALIPGQSTQINVRFIPQASGNRAAILNVVTNGVDSGTQSISLTGFGIAPTIQIDSNIRFKKTRTRMGDSLTQWVHITAVGQAALFFNGFPIYGIDANQYFVSHFPANPIAPGQTDSLGITYVPTKEGLHAALLVINSNASNIPLDTVSLRGTGILPHIVVSPTPLLFDSTAEGDTVCKQITIWNPGSDTLRLKANGFSSNDGDFHYTGLTGPDTAIAPDHTKIVTVCFIPKQQGTRQARLLFKTNIINTFETPRRDTASIITIDIRGNGLPLGILANTISGLPVMDSALIGVQVCRTDTLWNNGDADILVTGATFIGTA
ncbi:MAG: choice-of-anchor D domain-containing protein, partial [Bacteroidota bacterium]|nr:choice-of-anchor D domain-containing protein [Bacteroidota bacterium]